MLCHHVRGPVTPGGLELEHHLPGGVGLHALVGQCRAVDVAAQLLQRLAVIGGTAHGHRFDVVLSPVAPVSAFAAGWAVPTNDPLRAMQHIGFMLPFNMSEQPAISVPCGFTAGGLPMWLQIAGHRFADLQVLGVARAFEPMRRPLRPWPVFASGTAANTAAGTTAG